MVAVSTFAHCDRTLYNPFCFEKILRHKNVARAWKRSWTQFTSEWTKWSWFIFLLTNSVEAFLEKKNDHSARKWRPSLKVTFSCLGISCNLASIGLWLVKGCDMMDLLYLWHIGHLKITNQGKLEPSPLAHFIMILMALTTTISKIKKLCKLLWVRDCNQGYQGAMKSD